MDKEIDLLRMAGFERSELHSFIAGMKTKLVVNSKKGNSWRTCSIDFLRGKLLEELGEYFKDDNHLELFDVANLCLMLYLRGDSNG